jgi:DNA-binding MarR family transcriptional regulator
MKTADRGEHLAFLIHDAENACARSSPGVWRRTTSRRRRPGGWRSCSARSGASLTALSEALEVQPMSLVRVVDDLEARGLFTARERSARSTRLAIILTADGEQVVDEIWRILDRIIAEACGSMGGIEIDALRAGLKATIAGLQKIQLAETT